MKIILRKQMGTLICFVLSLCMTNSALAGINLDRTRVIFDGNNNSVSLHVENGDSKKPYLAQSWIEDDHGNKGAKLPLVVVPPIQRIEPGASSQIRIQALPTVKTLPQDRESIFYLVMQDIPPKVNGSNVLQIAVQNRIKVMYRPKGMEQGARNIEKQWQQRVKLEKQGKQIVVTNPTPYHLTLLNASTKVGGVPVPGAKPVMVPPYETVAMSLKSEQLGQHPVLNYINDYGGVEPISLHCNGSQCVAAVKEGV